MIYLHDSKLLLKIQFEAQSPVKNVYFLEGYHYMSPIVRLTSVHYGAGRVFTHQTPPLHGAHPHSFPGRPCLLPPIFNGDPSGVWVGRAGAGTGAGNAEKDTSPQAVEWGGWGKGPGRVFRGPSAS